MATHTRGERSPFSRSACRAARRVLTVVLLSIWELSLASLSGGRQAAEAPPPLAPTQGIEASRLGTGPAVERPLAGGETHAYVLTLSAGQYVHVVVNQLGIDATLCFFDPRGNPLGQFDSQNGSDGPEPLFALAQASGDFRLEVRSLWKGAQPGRYTIGIAEMRPATPRDREIVAADGVFRAATDLFLQDSDASVAASNEKFREALSLYRRLREPHRQAECLQSLGWLAYSRGDLAQALQDSQEGLVLAREVGDPILEILTLNTIALVADLRGDRGSTLETLGRALELARRAESRAQQAAILSNIGAVYDDLGDFRRALDYYEQALPLLRGTGNLFGEGYTLSNVGLVYSKLGDSRKAAETYDQALGLRRQASDRRGEGETLRYLGELEASRGNLAKAVELYRQSIELLRAVGDPLAESMTRAALGSAYEELKEYARAQEELRQALEVDRRLDFRTGESDVSFRLARVERDLGHLAESRGHIEAALAIVESSRNGITAHDLRAAYLSSVSSQYELYIDVLMGLHATDPGAGFEALALHVSERARARGLLDLLTEARAEIRRGVDPGLLERRRRVQQLLKTKIDRKTALLAGEHSSEEAEAARADVEGLMIEHDRVDEEIRKTSPRYAALTQPQPLHAEEIRKLLDEETLLLEFSLGDRRSFLWAIRSDGLWTFELAPRREIEAAARDVYDAIRQRPSKASPRAIDSAAARLSDLVVRPAAALMGRRRLVVVADGALGLIPFGALPFRGGPASAERTPLAVGHEIVNLPSASVLPLLRREAGPPPAKTLIVLADPVFERDDARVLTGRESGPAVSGREGTPVRGVNLTLTVRDMDAGVGDVRISRLPFTRREADAIARLVPASDRREALDFDASRETAMGGALSGYRYVHFATHGLMNSVHPRLSGIVLSLVDRGGRERDGFLTAMEVFNLELSADLVVLSACRTGLGKEMRGEGMVGLTRAFMYAGAPRVVASLWKVDDLATADLMKRFYEGMLGARHLAPAAALREAQLSIRAQRRWEHPYYWAGFVLQGEWK